MRSNRAVRVMASIAGLSALTLVAACGGSPSQGAQDSGPTKAEKVFAKLSKLSGDEREKELVKEAEAEGGQLDLYTSMTSDVADAVTEAFSDKYDIDVNLYRASSETVLQRILQESGANFNGNDVVETDALEMYDLNKEKLLADYEGEGRDKVAEDGRFDGWTADRYNLFTPSWNTKMVPKGQQPTSWEDLADPKWDGKLAMELSDYDWYLTLREYWLKQGKSEDEVDKLFEDMADGAKIVKGHTVMGELLSAGQFAVASSNYSYLVQQVADKGAPVAYQPLVEPVIVRPNGFGLMKTAKHPATAMLFADWLLGDGQKALVEEGLTPTVPPPGTKNVLESVETVDVDVETLGEEEKKWSDRYDKLVENGTVVDQ
ncbi:MAG: extracellular solute-binding protein [Nocardioidaceae bacterium]|nr:extracellular solute-binding protein [Nocardioidaceae bacterium]